MMRWRIRRIVNGCAAQQLVARRGVIAPEFISHGLVIRAINKKVCTSFIMLLFLCRKTRSELNFACA